MQHRSVTREVAFLISTLYRAGFHARRIHEILTTAGLTVSLRHTYRLASSAAGREGVE